MRLPMHAALLLLALAGSGAATAQGASAFLNRPIYSEPSSGLQMPPNCTLDPASRARLPSGDLELWVVECDRLARLWLVRRAVIEMVGANQARLRFVVLDDRAFEQEAAGDTLSVQCAGRGAQSAGYAVAGAKWRQVGSELRLVSAQSALRVDTATQKLVPAGVSNVECTRFPEREAMMRRLQQGGR